LPLLDTLGGEAAMHVAPVALSPRCA
jgi:hypothetical protein